VCNLRFSVCPKLPLNLRWESNMKSTMIAGIVLIVIGTVSLIYQGLTYTDHKDVINLGPIKATDTHEKEIPIPPRVGGLLLSGGHDLDMLAETEDTPGARLQVKFSTSPRRDKQEIQLLKWAIADDKPVLGICRGSQLINVALGGNLHSHLPDNLPAAKDHEASIHERDIRHLAHQLELEPGSHLAKILGTTHIAANTLHHQAINKLGHGLVVTARAEDGVIEAIELPGKRFVIGVQSHPEAIEESVEPLWRSLFQAFVKSAAA